MTLTKQFITRDFLLETSLASDLYYQVAEGLPIIDYHNHINPSHIVADKQFKNITELWIAPDQYKHRAMRMNGIPEKGITGDANDKDKFLNWAKVLPTTIGNPLFHWSALELQRVFDIDMLLNEDTADEIWSLCNEKLQENEYSNNAILRKWNIESLVTSDDLLDKLMDHQKAPADLEVKPSLRADMVLTFQGDQFAKWQEELSHITEISFDNLQDYKKAVIERINAFEMAGCVMADHALDAGFRFITTSDQEADQFFALAQKNKLSDEDLIKLQSNLLVFLGREYHKRKWIMQLHIGAQRNTSSRLRDMVGKAGGYACIGSGCHMQSLTTLLDEIENEGLPKIILYTLNPADYEALASLTGSFSEDHVVGKIQLGPPWWYNDHCYGIDNYFEILSTYGLLSLSIGMTTDSRSILSFSRHEYFRRILCNFMGHQVQKGLIPNDEILLAKMARGVCYENIKHWLK